ncbi:MAG: glycosyltransferase [Candidatus Eremiobacteraeota bacterium]|nr:glycosyltransferase [Candidatus Eremiobacteraeota bacterium]
MSYNLSVIICTHNRADLLAGSIETLDKQEDVNSGDYEIIVVDDGSTDDTQDRIKNLNTDVEVRYFYKNWGGRSEARNLGIENAGGDVILFVDDDILAPPNFLKSHLKEYESGENIVVRGPIVNVAEYEIIPDFKPKPYQFSGAFFCTCNASTWRETLLRVGGFDTDFKEYGFEDNEIGWRLREAGCKVHFCMDAYIFHYKPDEGKEKSVVLEEMKKRAQELGRSAAIYYRKHPHWKVKMAIGIHPLNYYYTRILNNRWLAGMGENWIKSGKAENPTLHMFFSGRIFQYNYLSSLLDALKEEK